MAPKRAVTEFRITMPMAMDPSHIGSLYMVSKSSAQDSTDSDGVEFLVNEPYTSPEGYAGQFTEKLFHLEKNIPRAAAKFLPKSALLLTETCHNAFPHVKTEIRNGFVKSLYICVETLTVDGDRGHLDNALGLSDGDLELRKIVELDIKYTPIPKDVYDAETDPSLVPAFRTDVVTTLIDAGENWREEVEPVCTIYKVVTAELSFPPVTRPILKTVMKTFRKMMLRYHRNLYAWADEWAEMTLPQIRAMEAETKRLLEERRAAAEK